MLMTARQLDAEFRLQSDPAELAALIVRLDNHRRDARRRAPRRKAARRSFDSESFAAKFISMPMRRICSPCCARAANGHATAAQPSVTTISRLPR
jgi:hypothetical protein